MTASLRDEGTMAEGGEALVDEGRWDGLQNAGGGVHGSNDIR